MCGRFSVTHETGELAELFDAAPSNNLPETPAYNICPTQDVAVVTSAEGVRRLASQRWGFLPSWYKTPNGGPVLINARKESVAVKPAFREACRRRRCLVPASGFFEWTRAQDGKKLPWRIHPADGKPMAFAGIWEAWSKPGAEEITSFAIITTQANDRLSCLHSRMPVVIEREGWATWLGETPGKAAPLMKSAPDCRFEFHRVSEAVNSSKAQGASLIEAI